MSNVIYIIIKSIYEWEQWYNTSFGFIKDENKAKKYCEELNNKEKDSNIEYYYKALNEIVL